MPSPKDEKSISAMLEELKLKVNTDEDAADLPEEDVPPPAANDAGEMADLLKRYFADGKSPAAEPEREDLSALDTSDFLTEEEAEEEAEIEPEVEEEVEEEAEEEVEDEIEDEAEEEAEDEVEDEAEDDDVPWYEDEEASEEAAPEPHLPHELVWQTDEEELDITEEALPVIEEPEEEFEEEPFVTEEPEEEPEEALARGLVLTGADIVEIKESHEPALRPEEDEESLPDVPTVLLWSADGDGEEAPVIENLDDILQAEAEAEEEPEAKAEEEPPEEPEEESDVFAPSPFGGVEDQTEPPVVTLTSVDESPEPSTPEGNIADRFDTADLHLMMALGADLDLDLDVESELALRESEEPEREVGLEPDPYAPMPFGYRGKEYETPTQREEVLAAYREDGRRLLWRMGLIGVLTLLIALIENAPLFFPSSGLVSFMGAYPVIGAMMTFQLLVLAIAMSWRRLVTGAVDVIRFDPSPYSAVFLSTAFSVMYNLSYAFFLSGTSVGVWNLPAALCLLAGTGCEALTWWREYLTFRRLEGEGELLSLEYEHEDAYGDGRGYTVCRRRRPGSYFALHTRHGEHDLFVTLLLTGLVVVSVLLSLLSVALGGHAAGAMTTFFTAVIACLPLSYVLSYAFSLTLLGVWQMKDTALLLGEGAPDDCADVRSLLFDDAMVFEARGVSDKGLKIYEGDIYRILYYAQAVFAAVGGPARGLFDRAASAMRHSARIELSYVGRRGIDAVVDGTHRILIGSVDFLAEQGVSVARARADAAAFGRLYLAVDGVLSARLHLAYSLTPAFRRAAKELARSGRTVVIRTADPNLGDDFLAKVSERLGFRIRSVDKESLDLREDDRPSQGSVLSRRGVEGILSAIHACDRLRALKGKILWSHTASAGVALLALLALVIFGALDQLHSLYIALYQVFFFIVDGLVILFHFRKQ